MNEAVDIDELSDEEMERFNDTVQVFRGVSERQSFHSVPARDDTGVMNEVWFYWNSDDPKPRAIASIGSNGEIKIRRNFS
jgi:hypothetical protein